MSKFTTHQTVLPTEQTSEGRGTFYYGAGSVRRSLKHFLVGRGVSSIGSFIAAMIIVRQLSVDEYAGYTVLSGLLLFLAMVSNLGMDRIIPRYFPVLRQAGAEHELRRFCWRLFGLQVAAISVAVVLLWFFSPFVGPRLALPKLPEMILAFGALVLSFVLSKHLTRSSQALLLNKEATTGMSLEAILKLAVLITWIALSGEVLLSEVLWIQAITAFVGAAYMMWRLALHLRSEGDRPETEHVLDRHTVMRMGWQNYLWALTGFHETPSMAKLLGAHLLSGPATAALGFGYAITSVLQRYLPATLLIGLIEPIVMARYSARQDFSEVMKYISIVLKLNLFILLPATFWFIFGGRPLIELVTAGKYGDSAWLIAALMVVLMIQSHGLITLLICNALEHSELLLFSNLWSWLIVPLMIGAALVAGLPGLVGGGMLVAILKNVYVVFRLRRLGFPYRPDWHGIGLIVALSGTAGILGFKAAELVFDGVIGALVGAVLTAVLFLGLSYWWKPFSPAERETLNRLIGREIFVW